MAIIQDQHDLLVEAEREYNALARKHKIKTSFDTLDDLYFVKDVILKERYISTQLLRFICKRIVDFYMSWAGYLHSLLLPNPNSMINVTEHNMFDEEEKDKITELMNTILAFTSENNHLLLIKDSKADAAFIDESVVFWKKTAFPELKKLMKEIHNQWKYRLLHPPKD